MALIRRFVEKPHGSITWRSEVDCGFTIGHRDDRRVLHLETYGSGSRQIPGKVSQSLEIDEAGARELIRVLRRAFPAIN
jgi:hypothetical protein